MQIGQLDFEKRTLEEAAQVDNEKHQQLMKDYDKLDQQYKDVVKQSSIDLFKKQKEIDQHVEEREKEMSGCKKDHQELKEATDREIGDLKEQIDQIKAKKRDKKVQLTKTITEKDELIITLTEKVGLQDYTISDSQKTIKKLQSNLDENLNAFKEKDGRISSLEQQIIDLKQSLGE